MGKEVSNVRFRLEFDKEFENNFVAQGNYQSEEVNNADSDFDEDETE